MTQHHFATDLPQKSTQTWRAHFRAMLALGVPIVGSQVGTMLISTTDTIMLGWYGISELAAGALATQMFFITLTFGTGFGYAVVPLVAQAVGAGDQIAGRRVVKMGIWTAVMFGLSMMPILWFAEEILLAFGQDPGISALAGGYMKIAQWSMLPVLLWMTLRGFLSAIERAAAVFWVTVIGTLINAILNWVFIFGNLGAPEMGMNGAAIATLGTNFLIFGLLLSYATFEPAAAKYKIWLKFWKPDWQAFGDVARLGFPIALIVTSEVAIFNLATLFVGWMGIVPLAAHGIALQLTSLAFMVPIGLAQAATVRIGNAVGRGSRTDLIRAANVAFVICLLFAAFSSSLFFFVPGHLIGLFLDDTQAQSKDVIISALPILYIVAAYQFFDGIQAVAAGLLRGLKDRVGTTIIALFSYWMVGLLLAYALGVGRGVGVVGIWIGLAVGLAVASILMTAWFYRLVHRVNLKG